MVQRFGEGREAFGRARQARLDLGRVQREVAQCSAQLQLRQPRVRGGEQVQVFPRAILDRMWEGGWVTLHTDEIDPDSGWSLLQDWSASDGKVTKTYDRTYVDGGEPLVVGSRILTLMAGP